MTAPKNAGSLTAGLLARKGAAQPAMRRQPVTGLGNGPRAVTPLDDLGWNDMGEDVPPAHIPASAPSPVALHIAAIQETLDRRKAERRAEPTAPLAQVAPPPVATTPSAQAKPVRESQYKAQNKSRSAFTLRIDADRHLRLRLLSAVSHRSAQQLLTGALDALIADHPEIDALAANPKFRRDDSDTGTE